MSDTLVFGPADFVTGQPVVDGFVVADIGVTTTESEPGYVNGGRVELGSSGLAPVVINAVQDGATIVLGVMCRGDSSFDDCDSVVIALCGDGGAQRRIDIGPVWGNAGPTLDLSEVSQNGEGATTSVVDPPDNPAFDIYTNRNPHIGPTFYERANAAAGWSASAAPAGFECKVRSSNRHCLERRTADPDQRCGLDHAGRRVRNLRRCNPLLQDDNPGRWHRIPPLQFCPIQVPA
jgi:hypothetical protein